MRRALNKKGGMCYEQGLLEITSEISPQRWFYLAIATLSQVSIAIIHLGIPALAPLIQAELMLSRTEVGLLSSILNGSVVLSTIAAGKAADRLGERLLIVYGSMASGLFAMGMSWAASLAALVPVLGLIGCATATSTPAGSKAVARWFPASERGTAMGIRQMGIPLGGAIAAMTLPSLALYGGWRLALLCAGLVAIGMALAALYLYKEPASEVPERARGGTVSVRELLRRPETWAISLYVFILSGGQWCFLFYLPLYLTEKISFSLPLAASLLALGQICGTGGRIFFGLVSDRLFARRRRPALALVALVAALMTLGVSLFSTESPFRLISLVVAFWGMTLMGWNGVYLALVSELVGLRAAGIAIGLSNTGAFLGVAVLPPLFGFLVDQGGSYRLAWTALAGVILVAVAALGWVREEKGGTR